jgi:hypothetical protein
MTGTNSIYYTGGNVGIGTATPQTKLDVNGEQIKLGANSYPNNPHMILDLGDGRPKIEGIDGIGGLIFRL